MDIQIFVDKFDHTLVVNLQPEVSEIKSVHSGQSLILTPKSVRQKNGVKYVIPSSLNGWDYRLRIRVHEFGGCNYEAGEAEVVCGLNGKPLRPYYVVPLAARWPNGRHAYFGINGRFVTAGLKWTLDSALYTLRSHVIGKQEGMAWIETTNIWQGDDKWLPEQFEKYQAAMDAAHARAVTTDCLDLFYVID